jgi:hypothetical protein
VTCVPEAEALHTASMSYAPQQQVETQHTMHAKQRVQTLARIVELGRNTPQAA